MRLGRNYLAPDGELENSDEVVINGVINLFELSSLGN